MAVIIFISYRREDTQGEALHLFDDLKEVFGADRVFMDVTTIDPGKDFRRVIKDAVSSCDVLIIMIGNEWLNAADASGKRRLDDPKDFVRLETEAGLERDVDVIPVLVQGARMPHPEELPAELENLAWRNAFEIRHHRWDIDVGELIKALKKVVPMDSTPANASKNKSINSEAGDSLSDQKPRLQPFLSKTSITVSATVLCLLTWGYFYSFGDQLNVAETTIVMGFYLLVAYITQSIWVQICSGSRKK